jgi:hypothetical protein
MLDRVQTRALPLLNRSVDLAPAVQACCGVCRSCATTNIVAVAGAAAAGIAAAAVRFARRLR